MYQLQIMQEQTRVKEVTSTWQESFKVRKLNTLIEYAEARAHRCQKMSNDAEHFMTHAMMTRKDIVRSTISNFCNIRSVIFARLKPKKQEILDTCEYKVDMGIDGYLVPTRVYKILFSTYSHKFVKQMY